MADWWQSPRYEERKAAGEVVTPGLVDWGGLVNAFNAPYEARMAREAAAAAAQQAPTFIAPGGGRVTGYPGSPTNGGVPAKTDRGGKTTTTSLPYYGVAPANFTGSDPFQSYLKGYAATPRGQAPSLPNPVPKSGTTYYPQGEGVEYGYNTLTGNYEVKRAGQSYTSVKAPGQGAGRPAAPSVANPAPRVAGRDPAGSFNGTFADLQSTFGRPAPTVLRLASEPASDVSGQNMANSTGRPVSGPSGKVYYPSNTHTDKIRAPMSPVAERPQQQQQRSGGLFGSLFGGGNSGGGGGIFSGLFGGGDSSSSSPSLASRQTAPYAPGTTFEQRAAAAAARENLMNPPTETNWAAIEASAKNRR